MCSQKFGTVTYIELNSNPKSAYSEKYVLISYKRVDTWYCYLY